jgi:hypothetical protein
LFSTDGKAEARMLDAVAPRTSRDDDGTDATERSPPTDDSPRPAPLTFAAARQRGGALRAGIVRNDVPLRYRRVATLRGALAYVLGCRYLQLSRRDNALRFFQTAFDDAPSDSSLRWLARAELDRLILQR